MKIEDVDLADAMEQSKNPETGHAVVCFHDPTLQSCRNFSAILGEMKDSSLHVFRVDVTLEPELQSKFPAEQLPALYFFSQGLPMGRKPVFKTSAEFRSWLKFLDGLC
jgi:hypothetical protein